MYVDMLTPHSAVSACNDYLATVRALSAAWLNASKRILNNIRLNMSDRE